MLGFEGAFPNKLFLEACEIFVLGGLLVVFSGGVSFLGGTPISLMILGLFFFLSFSFSFSSSSFS